MYKNNTSYVRSLVLGAFLLVFLFNNLAVRAQLLDSLRTAVQEGNAAAALQLMEYFEMGFDEQNIPSNLDSAHFYLSQAARLGSPDAEYLVGTGYLYGNGYPKNVFKSIEWLEKAAKQNHVRAMDRLLYLYAPDSINPFASSQLQQVINYKRAFEVAQLAAKEKLPRASFYLAKAYLNGKGVAKNDSLALFWLNESENNYQYVDAELLLGDCYFKGLTRYGVDLELATSYYRRVVRNPKSTLEQIAWGRIGIHEIDELKKKTAPKDSTLHN